MADVPNVNLDKLPTIPDKVVDKIRKGRDVPIEDISPLAAEMAHRRQENSKRPVYAGDLTPISKAEAQERRTFRGDSLPSMPATRRVIPKPFARDRIEIEHHGKTWQDVRAETIQPGDMVLSVGRVITVDPVVIYSNKAEMGIPPSEGLSAEMAELELANPVAVRVDLVLTNVVGDEFTVDSRAQVRVFRKAPDEPASETAS